MRIAVLSDIHSNLPALEAVLASVGSVDAIWQLGDVVGYGPDPGAVVARLREAGAIGVRGNHDAAAVGDLTIEDFNADGRLAMEWTRANLGHEDRPTWPPCRRFSSPTGSTSRSRTEARAIRYGST